MDVEENSIGFSQRFIPMNETRSPSMAESLKGGGGDLQGWKWVSNHASHGDT